MMNVPSKLQNRMKQSQLSSNHLSIERLSIGINLPPFVNIVTKIKLRGALQTLNSTWLLQGPLTISHFILDYLRWSLRDSYLAQPHFDELILEDMGVYLRPCRLPFLLNFSFTKVFSMLCIGEQTILGYLRTPPRSLFPPTS